MPREMTPRTNRRCPTASKRIGNRHQRDRRARALRSRFFDIPHERSSATNQAVGRLGEAIQAVSPTRSATQHSRWTGDDSVTAEDHLARARTRVISMYEPEVTRLYAAS